MGPFDEIGCSHVSFPLVVRYDRRRENKDPEGCLSRGLLVERLSDAALASCSGRSGVELETLQFLLSLHRNTETNRRRIRGYGRRGRPGHKSPTCR